MTEYSAIDKKKEAAKMDFYGRTKLEASKLKRVNGTNTVLRIKTE
jgi:hypothetical protein